MRAELKKLNWGQALAALLVLGTLTALVIWLDLPRQQQVAMLGAGLSSSTGLGRLYSGRRWTIPLLDIAGKTLGVLAGIWAGHQFFSGYSAAVPCMVLGAFAVGALSRHNSSLWWVLIQTWVFFSLAAVFFDKVDQPLHLAGLVLLTQVAVLLASHTLIWLWRQSGQTARCLDKLLEENREHAPAMTMLWQGLQCMLAVALALVAAHYAGIERYYWAPLSTLFVLRTDLRSTRASLVSRMLATLAGTAVATLVIILMPVHLVLPLMFVLSAALMLLLLPLGFPYFIGGLTAALIFMVTMANAELLQNASDRVTGTLLGGVAAFLIQWLAHSLWCPEGSADPETESARKQ